MTRPRHQTAHGKHNAMGAQREIQPSKLRLKNKKQRFTAAVELKREDPTLRHIQAMKQTTAFFLSPLPLKKRVSQMIPGTPPTTPSACHTAVHFDVVVVRTRLSTTPSIMCRTCDAAGLCFARRLESFRMCFLVLSNPLRVFVSPRGLPCRKVWPACLQ